MSLNRRHGLGRGLDALIPPARADANVLTVEIERIVPNPRQPRQRFTPEATRELAESIRAHGVIQPLVVTLLRSPEGDAVPRYQLIAGERRWQAAKLAGLAAVPVIVREATPEELLELALIENIQRADLNPLEEAAAYRQLMDDFHLTQEQVAAKVGKSRVAVANTVRLLRLPEEARRALSEGQISEGHARALLRLETLHEQRHLLGEILSKGLSVRQAETRAEREREPERKRGARARSAHRDPHSRHLEEQFRRALGAKVTLVRHRNGAGRLIVEFFSDEELQALHDQIIDRRK